MDLNDLMNVIHGGQDLTRFLIKDKMGYKLEDKEEFGIVRDTLVKYGMPSKNFDKNLSRLVINEKYNENEGYGKSDFVSSNYLAKNNKIGFPDNKEDFVHELFHMASNNYSDTVAENNALMGCETKKGNNTFGESLNDGITDYFTSLAVKNYIPRYPIESFIVSYIAKIYGMNVFKEHFNEDPDKFYSYFGQDRQLIEDIVESLDEYFRTYILIYDDISRVKHEDISEDEKNDKIMSIYNKNGNRVAINFVKTINKFIKLMQLKDLEYKEFIGDLIIILNDENNEFVKEINEMFKFSLYMNTENIIKEITEKIEEEEFKL